MKTFTRIAITSIALLATTLVAMDGAEARKRRHHYRNDVVLGAAAVTAGVIVGATLASPRYYRPRTVIVERPAPVVVRRVYQTDVTDYDAPDYYDPSYEDARPDYAEPQDDSYADTNDEGYYPPAPRHEQREDYDQSAQGNLEPWTEEWRDYCSQRYRTFNQRTGTYHGVDGRDHFCTAG